MTLIVFTTAIMKAPKAIEPAWCKYANLKPFIILALPSYNRLELK